MNADPINRYGNLQPFKPGENRYTARQEPKKYKALVHKARVTSLEMLEVAIGIARDPYMNPQARLNAAAMVIERAWGKPKEQLELAHASGAQLLRIEIVDPGGETEAVTIEAPVNRITDVEHEQAAEEEGEC